MDLKKLFPETEMSLHFLKVNFVLFLEIMVKPLFLMEKIPMVILHLNVRMIYARKALKFLLLKIMKKLFST